MRVFVAIGICSLDSDIFLFSKYALMVYKIKQQNVIQSVASITSEFKNKGNRV